MGTEGFLNMYMGYQRVVGVLSHCCVHLGVADLPATAAADGDAKRDSSL